MNAALDPILLASGSLLNWGYCLTAEKFRLINVKYFLALVILGGGVPLLLLLFIFYIEVFVLWSHACPLSDPPHHSCLLVLVISTVVIPEIISYPIIVVLYWQCTTIIDEIITIWCKLHGIFHHYSSCMQNNLEFYGSYFCFCSHWWCEQHKINRGLQLTARKQYFVEYKSRCWWILCW